MKQVARFALIVLLTLTALLLLWQFREVVAIFVLSLAVAAAVRPPIEYLAGRRVPHGLATVLTYLLVIGGIGLLLYFLSGPLVGDLQRVSNDFASGYERLRTAGPSMGTLPRLIAQQLPPLAQFYTGLAGEQGAAAAQAALGFTIGLFDTLSKVALVLILSIYWGLDRVHFERLWLSILPAEQRAGARIVWRSVEAGVGAYIRSEVAQGVLAGLLLGFGFMFMGMPYPAILALVGALAWLVPLVGGVLAVVPVLLVGLGQGPALAVGAVLFTLVVFVVLEVFVEPRVFWRRRYNSLLLVITMIAMANAMGVAGLLLAPPLAVAIQIFFRQLWAEPLVPAPLRTPQMVELEERLANLRRLVNSMQGGPTPEALSLLGRLEHLVEQAHTTLEEQPPQKPRSGFARLAAAEK